MSQFQDLLEETSEALSIPFHAEKGRFCQLRVDEKLHVQLLFEEERSRILIGTFLGEVAAGRFREDVFIAALKMNDVFPRIGTFAYVERNNQIALFTHMPLPIQNSLFISFLMQFIDYAEVWRSALERGRIP